VSVYTKEKLGLVMFFTGIALICAMYVRGSAGLLQAVFAFVTFAAGVFLYVLAEDK